MVLLSDTDLFLSLDEVAAFLLYVKTLGYQDQPDYQHAKHLLASAVRGRLDFSMPESPATASSTRVVDPGTREKVRGTDSCDLSLFNSNHCSLIPVGLRYSSERSFKGLFTANRFHSVKMEPSVSC